MEDLRLIGVHEDGDHLLLASRDGTRYRLPLTAELVAAARMPRPKIGNRSFDHVGEIRPREIQAMVRSGMTAQEVAERSGWDIEKIRKYEAPVLAEREHVASLARASRLRSRSGGGLGPTLANRALERLTQRDVPTEDVVWDSWRSHEGHWAVVLTFAAGGRQRQATWAFDPATSHVSPADDEARWLSEDERSGMTAPIPTTGAPASTPRGLGTEGSGTRGVYDVEADGGVTDGASGSREAPAAAGQPGVYPDAEPESASSLASPETTGPLAVVAPSAEEPVDLMAAMRERSGARGRGRGSRRRSRDQRATPPSEAPEAPSSEPSPEPSSGPSAEPSAEPSTGPSAGPSPEPSPGPSPGPSAPSPAPSPEPSPRPSPRPSPDVSPEQSPEQSPETPAPPGEPGSGTAQLEFDVVETTPSEANSDDSPPARPSRPEAAPVEPPKPRKPTRPSVPTWDDVMFGAKRDDPLG